MARIELSDVHVSYPVYTTLRQRSILGLAANRASFGRIARDVGNVTVVNALNGLDLDLSEGDRLAIVGRNGAGKTTLLKLCAGLILPDSGRCKIAGTRASIFNLTAGMDPDKTGLENVHMLSQLLGVPRKRREALLDDVIEFTELGDFIGLPVRTYSSGMAVRLAFALATSVDRDILVVDEAIGAGDALFLKKAAQRVRAMFDRAKILVLATHSGEIAAQLCNKAIWLESGRLVMAGEPAAVWDAYVHQRVPQKIESAA
jgi:ABC-type polysaccharide/polyol phosphate transport system ATPase subunit